MLPKLNRLPSPDIRRVLKNGTRMRFGWTDVAISSSPLPTPRFAVIVNKSVQKKAAARNRIKRVIRESLRHLVNAVSQKDIVWLVRKDISLMKQIEVEKMILGIISNGSAEQRIGEKSIKDRDFSPSKAQDRNDK